MSVSLRSGARGFQRLHNVQQWESIFTVGLYAAKSTECIKNASNKNGSELNLLKKQLSECISLSPPAVEWGGGGFKDCHFRNIIMYCNGAMGD